MILLQSYVIINTIIFSFCVKRKDGFVKGDVRTMAYNAAHDKYRALWKRDEGPQVNGWKIDYSYYSPMTDGAPEDKTYPLVVITAGALEGWAEGIEIQANEMPLWVDEKYQSRFHNGHAFMMVPRARRVWWNRCVPRSSIFAKNTPMWTPRASI